MTALELFAILVLAGAIIVLLYYYLQDTRGSLFSNIRPKSTGNGNNRTLEVTEGISKGVSKAGESMAEGVSKAGEKIKKTGTKTTDTSAKMAESGTMAGMSERMAGMGEKIKGKVREVPISTDLLSNRIESFLNEQSDQLIKDWELATKSDLSELEKRFDKVSLDVGELEKRFNEYRGFTNKRLESIDKRLGKLESPEDDTEK
jgi:hypothetical protein